MLQRTAFSDKRRPEVETRFAIGLLLFKHIFALSDEAVCERWVYDPLFPLRPILGTKIGQKVAANEDRRPAFRRNLGARFYFSLGQRSPPI